MKSIKVLLDETLLAQLDADEEVKRDGRSAVLRRAAAAYLRTRRRSAIAEAYRCAYRSGDALGKKFSRWTDEGAWPEM